MNERSMMEMYVAEKFGLPDEWRLCFISAGDGPPGWVTIQGAVWDTLKSGKRKGRTNFKKPLTEISTHWYEESAFDAWLLEWEKRTGLCHRCRGSGQETASVSVKDGVTYRPCSRCQRKAAT